MSFKLKNETHRSTRIGWLRAAVLGANDGLLSISSLIVGVAAAQSSSSNILLTGVAGLTAGAMSMAAGEYVSVSSQADTEQADLARERHELATDPQAEHEELAEIYVGRGLKPEIAREVASQFMAHDALSAHARDELGISMHALARPVQAAVASAGMFAVGGAIPLLIAMTAPRSTLIAFEFIGSLCALAILGGVAAHVGLASVIRGATRVAFWGAFAMSVTVAIGHLFGSVTL
jgi:VIT1/CCC1 family predicted Fe2+/Mn2+ transporter